MAKTRPSFTHMWTHFRTIYGDGTVASVGIKIGGKVQENIDLGEHQNEGFKNACAIRMSYTLGHSGVVIGKGKWLTSSGADKKLYIYRVTDLILFLEQTFGKPDRTIKHPKPGDLAAVKGILVFKVTGWSNASGHATLWDGTSCSDHCFFNNATEASIWKLK